MPLGELGIVFCYRQFSLVPYVIYPAFVVMQLSFLIKHVFVLKIFCCCFLSVESSNLLCLAG